MRDYATNNSSTVGVYVDEVAYPVILSSFWANHLHLEPENTDSPLVAAEFVGTSITSNGPSYEAVQAVLPNNPQIRFYDSRVRGYLSLQLQAQRLDVRLQAISDRADPQATVSTLKRFSLENGDAQLHDA